MGEDTQKLDEVVVTALGIKRSEKALSYNVQKVNNAVSYTHLDVYKRQDRILIKNSYLHYLTLLL